MTEVPPGHGPFGSDSELERFCRGFDDRTLPKASWTHRAHLVTALWHRIRAADGPRALAAMRDGIRRYNEAVGTANTPTGGYHETVTVLYCRLVGAFYRGADPARGFAALANDLYDALGDRDVPYRHYTRERLWSVEARLGWIEPDRSPLPEEW